MENWADVIGYEGLYRVSDQGRVMRLTGYRAGLIQGEIQFGYHRVALSKDGLAKKFQTHTLVIAAFLGPLPDGKETNHKNGKRADNRIENLEYVTRSENQKHAYTNLGKESQKGSAHGRSKISEEIAVAIRIARDAGEPVASIAIRFKVSQGTVSLIGQGKIWRHVVTPYRTRPRFKNNG